MQETIYTTNRTGGDLFLKKPVESVFVSLFYSGFYCIQSVCACILLHFKDHNRITIPTISGILLFILICWSNAGFAQTIPPANLCGYWSLDGNTLDGSGNNNNGSLQGGATYCPDRFGAANKAVKLGGYYNSSAIHIPNSSSLHLNKELTIACWFKLDDAGGMDGWRNFNNTTWAAHNFISKDGDRGGFFLMYFFYFSTQSQNISFAIHNNTSCNNTPDFSYNDNQSCINTEWRHVAVVVDSVSITMYINGMQKHRQTYSSQVHFTQANQKDLTFGRFGYNCGYNPNFWFPLNGKLDDIVYYNRSLSQAEINSLYNYPTPYAPTASMDTTTINDNVNLGEVYEQNGFSLPAQNEAGTFTYSRTNGCDSVWILNLTVANPCENETTSPPVSGLIAYYPFNGNANDESPNHNHGIVHGAILTTDRFGNANGAYHFDGINDWIEIPQSDTLDALTTNFTVSLWVKSPFSYQSPYCKSQLGNNCHFQIQPQDNQISIACFGRIFLFAGTAPTNVWYHLVVIYTNNAVRLFINDNEITQIISANYWGTNSNNNNLSIGRDPAGAMEYHNGEIDEVMIYRRALTEDEISQIYYNTTTLIIDTICEGETYSFNNQNISVAGIYSDTLTTVHGCDSVVTLNLTVKPLQAKTITDTVCSTENYNFYGTVLTTSGTYTATISGAECDTLVTLHLTVNQAWNYTLNIPICEGESYLFNGTSYNTTGIYTASLQTVAGCDSIITLNLTVNSPYAIQLADVCCINEPYRKNGFSIAPPRSPGIYEHTLQLQTFAGCDSVVTLQLTVPEVSVAIEMTPEDFCETYYADLMAVTPNSHIEWSTGETAPTITVTSRGRYTVTVSDSSGKCQAIDLIDIAPCKPLLLLPNTITPGIVDGVNDWFSLSNPDAFEAIEIYIYNRWGNRVFSSQDPYFRWDGTFKGALQSGHTFSYIIYYTPLQDKKQVKTGVVIVW